MNSLQVQRALAHVAARTVGVFPADQIPQHWERPCALVVNTDDSSKPGTHWVAIYVSADGHASYFDSYGLPPTVEAHLDRIRRNSTSYEWSIPQLQSIDSSVCGQFCIAFLFYMSHGYDLRRFCSLFSTDTVENDRLSLTLFNHITKCKKIHKNKNIVCSRCKQSCRPKSCAVF